MSLLSHSSLLISLFINIFLYLGPMSLLSHSSLLISLFSNIFFYLATFLCLHSPHIFIRSHPSLDSTFSAIFDANEVVETRVILPAPVYSLPAHVFVHLWLANWFVMILHSHSCWQLFWNRAKLKLFFELYRSGSTCFWAFRIRILLSSCKNSKKNLDSYYFVTLFDFLSLKNDGNVASKSNK